MGDAEDPHSVNNVDAEIVLPDNTRWSATFITLDAIKRIMDRWHDSGEHMNGKYFVCPDLIIVSTGGVSTMVESL